MEKTRYTWDENSSQWAQPYIEMEEVTTWTGLIVIKNKELDFVIKGHQL